MAQEATSPAKARHYGPSFQQLLLLAFLLIAGLLGTSALRALFTLEALMTESQASAAQAAANASMPDIEEDEPPGERLLCLVHLGRGFLISVWD